LNAGLDCRVLVVCRAVTVIQRAEQFELAALVGLGNALVSDILNQFFHLSMARIDVGSLVGSWQKPRTPVLRPGIREAARTHGDETGKVLVLRPEAIRHPGTEAGPDQARIAAVHQQNRGLMVRHVGSHGADHGDVVDALADVGKDFTNLDPAAPIALELEWRPESRAGAPFGLQVKVLGEFLAVILVEGRLGIKGIDMRRSTAHEQVNHALGLGGKLGFFRRQRRFEAAGCSRRTSAGIAQHGRQGQRTHAHAATTKQFPARQQKVFPSRLVVLRCAHGSSSFSRVYG
jgi:hypothetical protein